MLVGRERCGEWSLGWIGVSDADMGFYFLEKVGKNFWMRLRRGIVGVSYPRLIQKLAYNPRLSTTLS